MGLTAAPGAPIQQTPILFSLDGSEAEFPPVSCLVSCFPSPNSSAATPAIAQAPPGSPTHTPLQVTPRHLQIFIALKEHEFVQN